MIVIEGGHPSTNLHRDIKRLTGLLADMKRLATGRFPEPDDLAGAPILDEYLLIKTALPCLAGMVNGHPRLSDGHLITTSDLWLLAPEQKWARTLSRTYVLGRPWGDEDL